MASNTFAVIPETPENSRPNRRRSSRLSTMASTLATASILKQIDGTPQSMDSQDYDRKKTIIGESPMSLTPGTTKKLLDSNTKKTNFHPVFLSKFDATKKDKTLDFEEFAPATQQLDYQRPGSLTPKTKVQAWLINEQVEPDEDQSVSFKQSPLPKRRRRSSVQSVSKVLLNRSNNLSTNTKSTPDTSDDFETELAKILEKKKKAAADHEFEAGLAKIIEEKKRNISMFSTQSSTASTKKVKNRVSNIIDILEEDSEEICDPKIDDKPKNDAENSNNKDEDHVPYRPPSFQDYSSDSAKALMAKLENNVSLTPKAESTRITRRSSMSVRKTKSLDHVPSPKSPSENNTSKDTVILVDEENILKNVTAYVEVRSKNENRSDVVIDQLLSLGATVVPKIGAKCTHVVFKEGSLSTYNRAKKLGLYIVSVNWIEACQKAKEIVDEEMYPTMNQEKYDSPGLFPKLRKTKSLQPKTDEEFARIIDAKAKRIMKKKLAESPIETTPRASPKMPKRRRSHILDTLKEYEEQEKETPEAPASPCSSEELNTPLLKRIAKRLFKANQNSPSEPETPTTPSVIKDVELEISNDGLSDPAKTPLKNKSPVKRLISPKSPVFNTLGHYPSTKPPNLSKLTPKSSKIPITTPKSRPLATLNSKSKDVKKVPTARKAPKSPAAKTPKSPAATKPEGSAASKSRSATTLPKSSAPKTAKLPASKTPKSPASKTPKSPATKAPKSPAAKAPKSITENVDPQKIASVETTPTSRPLVNAQKSEKLEKDQQDQTPKSRPTLALTNSGASNKSKPRKSLNKTTVKPNKKKKLYTQNVVLSETPTGTPTGTPVLQPIQNQMKTKTKTKITRKGSLIIAQQENICPKKGSNDPLLSKTQKKAKSSFKKPLKVQKPSQKRLVRSMNYSRRSSLDFVQQPVKATRPKKAIVVLPPKELVLTSCPSDDTHLVKQLIKKLPGKATLALQVKSSTTHVISGEEKRTLNMLKAVLRGCWVVSNSWLYASIESGAWVDEEPYELVTFSSAVKARRLEREAEFFRCDMLHEIGKIYIGRLCKVPKKDLNVLVHLAGGQTVNQLKLSQVIVGHDFIEQLPEDQVQVSEKWLLDSLQQFCPLPFVDYLNVASTG